MRRALAAIASVVLALGFFAGPAFAVTDDEVTALDAATTGTAGTEPSDAVVSDADASGQDQYPADQYFLGRVVKVEERGTRGEGEIAQPYQISRVRVLSGPDKDKEYDIEHAGVFLKVSEGDKVVLVKVTVEGEGQYYISDQYRIPSLVFIVLVFFAVAAILGRRHGVMSIVGLAFSILVLASFVVPQIIAGRNPLAVTLIAAVAVMIVSLYLAHGVNRRTTLALTSTAITLAVAVGLAALFVHLTKLMGLGSDDAMYLQFGSFSRRRSKRSVAPMPH